MNRRQRSDGQYEVLVNTPMGYVWQLESLKQPGAFGKTSEHYSAGYNPYGRNPDVPASAYTKSAPYTNMFDDIFGGLVGQNQPKTQGIGGAPKKGGRSNPRPEAFPYYKTPLYLKKRGVQ